MREAGWVATGLLTLVLLGVLGPPLFEPEERFCTMGLSGFDRNDMFVATQDQGDRGRDGCDFHESGEPYPVAGFDCRLRAPDGEVIATLEPNSDDGTCVMAAEYPESWRTE